MMKMTSIIFALVVWLGSFSVSFALEPVYSDFLGKAIKGYDPVAYFTQKSAIKGTSEFVYQWKNAKWYFSSKANLDTFKENPNKFAPQYGGYCAWAVSQGYTAKIDPKAWRVHDGKLYLNYNKSVQTKWSKDVSGNILKADKNWPKLLN